MNSDMPRKLAHRLRVAEKLWKAGKISYSEWHKRREAAFDRARHEELQSARRAARVKNRLGKRR